MGTILDAIMGGCIIIIGVCVIAILTLKFIETEFPRQQPIDVAAERKKIIGWQREALEEWEQRFCAATGQRYRTPEQRRQDALDAAEAHARAALNAAMVQAYHRNDRQAIRMIQMTEHMNGRWIA